MKLRLKEEKMILNGWRKKNEFERCLHGHVPFFLQILRWWRLRYKQLNIEFSTKDTPHGDIASVAVSQGKGVVQTSLIFNCRSLFLENVELWRKKCND